MLYILSHTPLTLIGLGFINPIGRLTAVFLLCSLLLWSASRNTKQICTPGLLDSHQLRLPLFVYLYLFICMKQQVHSQIVEWKKLMFANEKLRFRLEAMLHFLELFWEVLIDFSKCFVLKFKGWLQITVWKMSSGKFVTDFCLEMAVFAQFTTLKKHKISFFVSFIELFQPFTCWLIT